VVVGRGAEVVDRAAADQGAAGATGAARGIQAPGCVSFPGPFSWNSILNI